MAVPIRSNYSIECFSGSRYSLTKFSHGVKVELETAEEQSFLPLVYKAFVYEHIGIPECDWRKKNPDSKRRKTT
jgi:hypothetical protein